MKLTPIVIKLLSPRESTLRQIILDGASDDLINHLSMLIHNILAGRIPITDNQKQNLIKYSKFMREVTNKGIKKARKTFKEQGVLILPKLAKILMPVIKDLRKDYLK